MADHIITEISKSPPIRRALRKLLAAIENLEDPLPEALCDAVDFAKRAVQYRRKPTSLRGGIGIPTVSLEKINEDVRYDPISGSFRFVRSGPRGQRRYKAGDLVDSINNGGYLRIIINGQRIVLHRLAWRICYGRWPNGPVDHINGIRTDNRIANLRECTHAQNVANTTTRYNNRSGYKGVTATRNGRYDARITVNGKERYLGRFTTAAEANAAYKTAALKQWGEFARWE